MTISDLPLVADRGIASGQHLSKLVDKGTQSLYDLQDKLNQIQPILDAARKDGPKIIQNVEKVTQAASDTSKNIQGLTDSREWNKKIQAFRDGPTGQALRETFNTPEIQRLISGMGYATDPRYIAGATLAVGLPAIGYKLWKSHKEDAAIQKREEHQQKLTDSLEVIAENMAKAHQPKPASIFQHIPGPDLIKQATPNFFGQLLGTCLPKQASAASAAIEGLERIPFRDLSLGKKILWSLPSVGAGAGEAYLNYDPDHPATAWLGGTLGVLGGSKMGPWNSAKVRSMAPYATVGGGLIPRTMTALLEHTKGEVLRNASLKKLLNTPEAGLPWKDIGAGVLGVGALAALWRLAGKPAPDTHVTLQGGESGGSAVPPAININMPEGFGAGGQPALPAPTNPDGTPAASAPTHGLGTLRVTLPTRHAKDHETVVEMPLENVGLSKSIYNKIRRDTKRRLRSESEERTLHRSFGDSMTEPESEIELVKQARLYRGSLLIPHL